MADYELSLERIAVWDLKQIAKYIFDTLGAPEGAKRIIAEIERGLNLLRSNPYMAPISRDPQLSAQGFRTLPCGKYLVFYKVDDKNRTVTVYRIIYGKRNLEWLFP